MSELMIHLLLVTTVALLGQLLKWLFTNTILMVINFLLGSHKDLAPAEFYKIVLNKEKI